MRMLIDLPDDLYRQAMSIARDTAQTLSETVIALMHRGLSQDGAAQVSSSSRTGLPVVRLGTMITTDDARAYPQREPPTTTIVDHHRGYRLSGQVGVHP